MALGPKKKRSFKKFDLKLIIGIDEAGRGALAGPVVAAAVAIKMSNVKYQMSNLYLKPRTSPPRAGQPRAENLKIKNFELRDSKKLTPKKREEFYKMLTSHPQIVWATGKAGPKVIDRLNILEATKLAMARAVEKLISNLKSQISKPQPKTQNSFKNIGIKDSKIILIIDGNFKIKLNIFQKPIVRADEKIFLCQAASIIAKVKRDEMMARYHKKFPQYGFGKHKGYPTKLHLARLQIYGLSVIHRLTFGPCKNLVK
jgi:ribonuclease HII